MQFLSLFEQHGFELSLSEKELFQKFLTLFVAYNTHTNLSAIREEGDIVIKHFIDSLYGAQVFQDNFSDSLDGLRVLDIGSGGGFPGIPLQIVLPMLEMTLLDSVGKKVNATNHFVKELGLKNIQSIKERAEVLAKNPLHAGSYDVVVSRATAYITDILTWATPFLKKDGFILLYKMPSKEEKADQKKILTKLGLKEFAQYEYDLADKKRLLLVFQKK